MRKRAKHGGSGDLRLGANKHCNTEGEELLLPSVMKGHFLEVSFCHSEIQLILVTYRVYILYL